MNAWLYAKASYEFASRVPTSLVLLGDGALALPSPNLKPERRQALNVGVQASAPTGSGEWSSSLTGFYRDIQDLILQQAIGNTRFVASSNVYSARSLGVELTASCLAPGRWLLLDANGAYQDYRNSSDEGQYVDFSGQRIPNTPWLFANASLRLQQRGVFAAQDEVALTSYPRHVHGHWLSWEDVGLPETKLSIPSYTTASLGAVYTIDGDRRRFTSSIEVQNLADTCVVDVFGLQRPGRALYAKPTVDYF